MDGIHRLPSTTRVWGWADTPVRSGARRAPTITEPKNAEGLRLLPDPQLHSNLRISERSMTTRMLPVSAEIQPRGGVHFRVWAPASKTVKVRVGKELSLEKNAIEKELAP